MAHASITMQPIVDEAEIRRAAHLLVLSAAWRAVAGAASGIAGWYIRRRQANRNILALSRLSDRMLKDIGVARCDIPRIARRGRDATDPRW